MEPQRLERKKLVLVGLERYMNVDEGFVDRLGRLKGDLIARLAEIEAKTHPERFVGCWQAIPGARKCDRMYLAAAEVDAVVNLPDGMVAKALPESLYAIWNEGNGEEGTVSPAYFSWLAATDYEFNTAMVCDFEVYQLDPDAEEHEVWVPVVRRGAGPRGATW